MSQATIYFTHVCPERGKAGAWASRVVFGGMDMVKSGHRDSTSPGEMDLYAALSAIGLLEYKGQPLQIIIKSNSSYFNKALSDWAYKWEGSGWKTKTGDSVKHQDLWKQLLGECRKHTIKVDFDQSDEALDVFKTLEKESRLCLKNRAFTQRDYNKAEVEHNKQVDSAVIGVVNSLSSLTVEERREVLTKAFMRSLNLPSVALLTGAELEEFSEHRLDGVEINGPGKANR